jgi:hypothetical protein
MRKLITLVIVALLAWRGYEFYLQRGAKSEVPVAAQESPKHESAVSLVKIPADALSVSYKCDGRVYCSKMTSCEEAKFFLQHCPGVKMDGDGDGVPCEQQWCGVN